MNFSSSKNERVVLYNHRGFPSRYDAKSIMLACFGSNEDGEFGFYDRVALEYLD
ncbi:MAG: M57 family metalloprotease [Bacteroidota bacterium]